MTWPKIPGVYEGLNTFWGNGSSSKEHLLGFSEIKKGRALPPIMPGDTTPSQYSICSFIGGFYAFSGKTNKPFLTL